MQKIPAVAAVAIAAYLTGFLAGHLWNLGNRAAAQGGWWLVLLSLFTNVVVAAAVYYPLRGAVQLANGTVLMLVLLLAIHLVTCLGTASWVANAIGAGAAVTMGAHTFSWGLSYAYGQAIHYVRRGTWLGD